MRGLLQGLSIQWELGVSYTPPCWTSLGKSWKSWGIGRALGVQGSRMSSSHEMDWRAREHRQQSFSHAVIRGQCSHQQWGIMGEFFSPSVLFLPKAGRVCPLSILSALQQPLSFFVFTSAGFNSAVGWCQCYQFKIMPLSAALLWYRTPEGVIFLWLINLETRGTPAQPLNYIHV